MPDNVPCLQIDAFTSEPFRGNPATVCLLEHSRSADWMQRVAAELNQTETAFVRAEGDELQLRWFTPRVEVDLCGHATLAAAHALWSEGCLEESSPIEFQTRSGTLTARKRDPWIELNFPATPATEVPTAAELLSALGIETAWCGQSSADYLIVVPNESIVRGLQPDLARLAQIPTRGVIVTAKSDDARWDFVSRFFAPACGIDEDHVTGSAHCCLAPYWSSVLGKDRLTGYQASRRGGIVQTELADDRVLLRGKAITIWRGELLV
ncbi:MAG: PhzF family phenazine biosynthesis protein [Pirellulales bacterium]